MTRLLRLLAAMALSVAVGLFAFEALAISLDEAKAQGLVGEQPNGYLGTVPPSAPEEVRRLVEEINLKRRAEYRDIARRNGTNLAAVEAIAGKKLVERAPSGQFVRNQDGAWVRVP